MLLRSSRSQQRSAGATSSTALGVAITFGSVVVLMIVLAVVFWNRTPHSGGGDVVTAPGLLITEPQRGGEESDEIGGVAPAVTAEDVPDESAPEPLTIASDADPSRADEPTPPRLPASDRDDAAGVEAPAPPPGLYLAAAGRSPYPQPGESIDEPIRLARLDEPQHRPPLAAPPEGSVIPWDQAARYVGHTITVEGTIVATKRFKDVCLLNFDTDWQGKFYLAVYRDAFENLPEQPEIHFLDKTVRVTGEVEFHRGDRDRPQIEVHDASRVTIVEP